MNKRMKKIFDTLLLAVLIAVFGVGGYKLGAKKERVEVIAAAPLAASPKQDGLPQAEPANRQPAASSTPAASQEAPFKPAPAVAPKPVAQVLGNKVTAKPASPKPAPAAQPSTPVVVPQPAAEPQPATKVS